ncbi:MAG: cell division protein FtsL [bacterium]
MIKFNFLTLFIFFNLSFLFVKIYQHNKSMQLNYEKQKLETNIIELEKEKNKLLIALSKLKNPHRIKKIAKNKFGLRPLKLSQVIEYPPENIPLKVTENLNIPEQLG